MSNVLISLVRSCVLTWIIQLLLQNYLHQDPLLQIWVLFYNNNQFTVHYLFSPTQLIWILNGSLAVITAEQKKINNTIILILQGTLKGNFIPTLLKRNKSDFYIIWKYHIPICQSYILSSLSLFFQNRNFF